MKEVRSSISDDFDKACLENQIMIRLNLAKNQNIVQQIAFFRDTSKQTTQLVMEALNGMTLLETLEDETTMEDLDDLLLDKKSSPESRPSGGEEETKQS